MLKKMLKKLLFVVTFDMIFAVVFFNCVYYLFGQTGWFNDPDETMPAFLFFAIAGPFFVFTAYTGLLYFVTFLPALWFSRGKPLKMRVALRVLAFAAWWLVWMILGIRFEDEQVTLENLWSLVTQNVLFWNPIAISGLLSTALSEPLWDYAVTKRAERRARRNTADA